MKRAMAIVLACMVLSSSAFAEDTIHTFWDIPFGIPLEEAAEMAEKRTGAVLEPRGPTDEEVWFFSTPEKYPLNIKGHPFYFSLSCNYTNKDKNQNDNNYNLMGLTKEFKGNVIEIERLMEEIQETVSDLYGMISEKCGEHDAVSFMYATAGRKTGSAFNIPMTDEGIPDIKRVYESGEKHFTVYLFWDNVKLQIREFYYDEESDIYSLYGEPRFNIDIVLTVYSSTNKPVIDMEYKGDYFHYLESLKMGVTSF